LALSNLLVFVDLVLLPQIDLCRYRLSSDHRNGVSPIWPDLGKQIMIIEGFLLGVIAAASLTASLFF